VVTEASQTPVPGEWLLTGEDWSGEITVETGDGDTQVVSGLFVLPTASSQDLFLQITLPRKVLAQQKKDELAYNLRVQKQAGLSQLPIVLQVKPPGGYQLYDLTPGWVLEKNSGFYIWTGEITSTQDFELLFSTSDGILTER